MARNLILKSRGKAGGGGFGGDVGFCIKLPRAVFYHIGRLALSYVFFVPYVVQRRWESGERFLIT